ncbi:MAG: arginine--tRNA ligase [Candidatus Zambryskibacteria bacterium]|nr:arginine--tRNA ligase [Candidatus Zambryskibacteria bacterium]
MKENLQKEIEKILKELGVKNPKVIFDYPTRMDFGDLSSNVGLVYAKELGKKPLELAEKIKEKLTHTTCEQVLRVEAVAPGFLNFFFDADYFGKIMDKAVSDNDFGKNKILEGQKIFIEHTQPNPFKKFHIGHLMNNTIGESITRIVKASGAEVKTASYHGDVGLHVAKAIFGMMHTQTDPYAYGHKAYEEDEEAKKEII